MLTPYRRHRTDCKYRSRKNNRQFRDCQCPIWVQGTLESKPVRRTLKERDWQKAQKVIREWEAEDRVISPDARKTLPDAWKDFLADLQAQQLSEGTLRKYRLLNRQMEAFAESSSLRFLSEFDVDVVSQFRAGWTVGAKTHGKNLERLRSFFRFAQQRKWVEENPAADLKAPKTKVSPTLPFSRDEMRRILAAVDEYEKQVSALGKDNARRLAALVLLLRYSGMRIGDAVGLSTDRIHGNRLFLYTAKTGVPINVILPALVMKTLKTMPQVGSKHFFWTGGGKVESVMSSWAKRLRRLFKIAKVSNGHAHRFRDTFAVELLLSGMPLEDVSILLGHSSVKITEKHYSPWVQARQDKLEAGQKSALSRDPLLGTNGGTQKILSL